MWASSQRQRVFEKSGLGSELLLFEIGIENHSQIADENAAEPSGADFSLVEEHKAIVTGWLEATKFFGEMPIKIDCEFARNFVLITTVCIAGG